MKTCAYGTEKYCGGCLSSWREFSSSSEIFIELVTAISQSITIATVGKVMVLMNRSNTMNFNIFKTRIINVVDKLFFSSAHHPIGIGEVINFLNSFEYLFIIDVKVDDFSCT